MHVFDLSFMILVIEWKGTIKMDTQKNYNDFFDCYNVALEEVKIFVFENLMYFKEKNNIGCMNSYRIKSLKSIKRKLEKKKTNSISDIAGIRVVFCDKCDEKDLSVLDRQIHGLDKLGFVSKFEDVVNRTNNVDINVIADFSEYLCECSEYKKDLKIIIDESKNYIKHPKSSGYQSMHLTIFYKGVPVELQIRNLAQHYFAEYEHEKRYKADEDTRVEYNSICDKCAEVLNNISYGKTARTKSLGKVRKIG